MVRLGRRSRLRLFSGILAVVLASCLWVGLNAGLSRAQGPVPPMDGEVLPPLQSYPLPPSLSQWQGPPETGNYFEQVAPTEFGYLLWSRFPVRILSGTSSPRYLGRGWAIASLG
ncbi:MAG: hypothetical protein HC890_05370, partial [Chloroflexaceae bacterium]|nr:hypothetical protein [Chloroflexaceae bacterium]